MGLIYQAASEHFVLKVDVRKMCKRKDWSELSPGCGGQYLISAEPATGSLMHVCVVRSNRQTTDDVHQPVIVIITTVFWGHYTVIIMFYFTVVTDVYYLFYICFRFIQ